MRVILTAMFLTAPGLVAQSTIALTAATPISVLTSEAGANTTFGTVAQNTTIGYCPNSGSLST
ncbi:MAG: hypothetical protein KDC98_23880, partial [Planctomycetes bacterium]|nr:hypothetical protein [Planctomycetota bacterium]